LLLTFNFGLGVFKKPTGKKPERKSKGKFFATFLKKLVGNAPELSFSFICSGA